MGNVKEVLEKQLEREKESAMQKLTTDPELYEALSK